MIADAADRALASEVRRLERRLARERAIRLEAERLLETKSLELFNVNRNLEQLNQDLELRVATRTGELERERRLAIRLAEQDTLTGLANRAKFAGHLERSLAAAAKSGCQVALLVFDIDRFKQFNDTFGHPCGDALLVAVAARVNALMREGDLFARLGGDEFAIIATFATDAENGARSLARRAHSCFSRSFEVDGHILHATATIGVALAPGHARTSCDLQRFADLALYAGKLAGRDRVSIFSDRVREAFEARWLMEERLRHAVEQEEIDVFYQPILDLRSGRIAGVEALARWNHPATGPVPPEQFIQIAEENQLIRDLGRQVLLRACADTQPWIDDCKLEFFSVNLSPIQVQDGCAVASILGAIAEIGIDPGTLVLEVTERLMLLDSPDIRQSLDALRKKGIRLALDDFGAGFSNLAYLNRFPIDRIKIDRDRTRRLCPYHRAVGLRPGPSARPAGHCGGRRNLGSTQDPGPYRLRLCSRVLVQRGDWGRRHA